MRFIPKILLVALILSGRLDAVLIGHLQFDEPAGATTALNQVAGSPPGIVGSLVTTGVAGVAGNAYRFNNNATQAGIVDLGSASLFTAIDASGEVTLTAWVKTADTTGGRNVALFLGNDMVNAGYIDLGLAATQVGQAGSANGRLRANGNIAEIFSTPTTINDNAWHHLALTIDLDAAADNLVLYVDGAAVSKLTVTGAQFPAFNNFEIGRLGRLGPADPFDGLVDDVQVYDEALPPEDIAFLRANPGLPIVERPPVVADDMVTMHPLSSVLLDVLKNDDDRARLGTVELVTVPAFGTAAVDDAGRIFYRHLSGTPSSDKFTYRVRSLSGVESEPVAVTIQFSTDLRLPNTTVNLPSAAPPVAFAMVNAFPGVSFTNPSTMESPKGDTKRLFVAERGGKIFVVPDVTAASPIKQLYLDLSPITLDDGNEQGLKGFALHPDFANNGYLFVAYNYLDGASEYIRLSRFRFSDPTSEKILINQLFEPESGNTPRIHGIDECNFGPDGYLYLGIGDGDGHPDPSDNSQRIDKNYWSALLRIDVDLEPEDYTPADGTGEDDANIPPNRHPAVVQHDGFPLYEIPADNPFIGATNFNGFAVDPANVRSEFYAVGLRNPWQFHWDPLNDNLWLADVGMNTQEEVNLISKGGNYGWAFLEGSLPTKGVPPPEAVLTGPVWEYNHGNGPFQGNSIIGGMVYRGGRYASLEGKYIFADYLSGNLWSMTIDAASPVVERIGGESGIACFALDPSDSSLLLLDHGDGVVRRLVSTSGNNGFPTTLSATGVFADLTDLSPNPGVVPYEPNLSFWSDHAIKRRWFVLKNSLDQFAYAEEGPWQSPGGAVFVKHFDLEMERGNPATKKRIETRLLVRTGEGSYGVSYRWNEQGTEADLVPDEGVGFPLNIIDQGTPVVQNWQIPSRSQCSTCHTSQGGHFLSLNSRQLNRPGNLAGASGNFISLLELSGYLDQLPQSPETMPRHVRPDETAYPLETRARSYLAVNCSYCHQSGGIGGGAFSLEPSLTLESTAIVNGGTSSAGDPFKLIVPGNHAQSVIWNRAANANGFTRMPPLASNQIDQKGIQLLREWIDQKLPSYRTYDQWRLENFNIGTSPGGDADADPDGDGLNNRYEFLTFSDPNSAASRWHAGLALDETSITFPNLEERGILIESSIDLLDWSRWNILGNDGLPVSGAARSFPKNPEDQQRFFRFRIFEQ